MTQICIVRHGETNWNLNGLTQGSMDIPLNHNGRQQARAAAAYLARETWHALYASPLSRAWETAAIIGEATGLKDIRTDSRLKERDFGSAEGLDVTERKKRFKESAIPGAEGWEQVRARALQAALDIARSNPGKRVVTVAHGGLIGGLLAELSGGELRPGRPPLENCSMTLLEYTGSWEILWFNRVAPEIYQQPAPIP